MQNIQGEIETLGVMIDVLDGAMQQDIPLMALIAYHDRVMRQAFRVLSALLSQVCDGACCMETRPNLRRPCAAVWQNGSSGTCLCERSAGGDYNAKGTNRKPETIHQRAGQGSRPEERQEGRDCFREGQS